jgi:hypothetical protein
MRKLLLPVAAVAVLLIAGIAPPTSSSAQETPALEVSRGVICTAVVEREPENAGTSFAKDVGTLFCFNHVNGAAEPTTITHVWYWGEVERARVELSIGSVSWRTNSSKVIMEHELGAWKVDVLDADGNVLKSIAFTITN